MTTQLLLNKLYGLTTDSNEEPVTSTVAATATQILLRNPQRLSWILTNNGSQNIRLYRNNTVTTTKGQLVTPGGVASVTVTEDFGKVTEELWAISSSGNVGITIEIQEIT